MGNGEFISTSILQKALELPAGCYIFRLSGEGYSGNDLPPGNNSYKYGTACIYKRSNTSIIVVLYGEAISSPMVINSYLTKWSGWQTYITNTDLQTAIATGDTVKKCADATIDSQTRRFLVSNPSDAPTYTANRALLTITKYATFTFLTLHSTSNELFSAFIYEKDTISPGIWVRVK